MSTPLFSPMKIGRKKNISSTVLYLLRKLTRFRCDASFVPTDLMVEYYDQRTTPGCLLISEPAFITLSAGSYPQSGGIYTKEQIAGWRKVTDRVHSKGSVIFLQLWHISRAAISAHIGHQPVSASDIPIKGLNLLGLPLEKPRPLVIPEIKNIVRDFHQAALNAMEAGFDGVEIHSANGYLLDQFLNTSSNKRIDIYGGSAENRCRFPLEVVDAVVDAIGADRTAIRFSPWSGFQDASNEKPYETWGCITQALQDRHPDLAYLHFIEPRADFCIDTYDGKQADTLDPFREIWNGPFISASGYTYNTQSAFDIAEKTGNLIAFGRLFISNPDLPERLHNGYLLNKYDRSTFYTHDSVGYTDYPFYKSA